MCINKKILLVIPTLTNTELDKFVATRTVPYGVLSLASYIEEKISSVSVEILDLNLSTQKIQEDIFRRKILEIEPDFIGFSAMFNSSFDQIPKLCEIAHIELPSSYLCVGGVFATNLPQDVFAMTDLIHAICYGEGEIPFVDLLQSNNIEETFKDHPSWLTKEDFLKGKQCKSTFVEDLDDIPFLNYEKVEINKYIGRGGTYSTFERLALPIHSTRGCPYNCVFCSAAANHGKKVRKMSSTRFLEDVKTMIDKYGIQKLSIDDDQFLFHRKRAIEILEGLAAYNIEVEVASGMNVKFVDDTIAQLLKKAGMEIATVAIESGSQRVLKEVIDKPLSVEQIPPSVLALKNAGIIVQAPFMFGLPGETEEDRQLSRELMLTLGLDWVFIFIAMPLKGSRLYDICIEKGYFEHGKISELNLNPYKCYIKAPNIDPEYLTKFAYELNLEVNFVRNHNYAIGNYERAISYFKKIAIRYPHQAFAHYYTALCLDKLGEPAEAKTFFSNYLRCINEDEEWYAYAKKFGLALNDNFLS